jgi:hypothetical protein
MRDQGAMMTEESLSQNRSHTKIEGNMKRKSIIVGKGNLLLLVTATG